MIYARPEHLAAAKEAANEARRHKVTALVRDAEMWLRYPEQVERGVDAVIIPAGDEFNGLEMAHAIDGVSTTVRDDVTVELVRAMTIGPAVAAEVAEVPADPATRAARGKK